MPKSTAQPALDKEPLDVLQTAAELIEGERAEAYGEAQISFNRIAAFWSLILGTDVTGAQVALCMMAVKMSREITSHKQDNIVDLIGYAALLQRLYER